MLIVVGLLAAVALLAFSDRPVRIVAVLGAMAVLLVAPTVWAFDTLGHATSGTFPEGGPASVQSAGGLGGPGGRLGGARSPAGGPLQLFGPGGASAGGVSAARGPGGGEGPGGATGAPPGAFAGAAGGQPGAFGGQAGAFGAGGPTAARGFGGGGPGGGFGGSVDSQVLSYVKTHGGGTIAVASQSSAASAIISQDAEVAGIGGFSGRESSVSVAWLAQEVSSGKIRWVLGEGSSGSAGRRLPGDTRAGSKAAIAAVEKACTRVSLGASSSSGQGAAGTGAGTLYDCRGRAAQLALAGA